MRRDSEGDGEQGGAIVTKRTFTRSDPDDDRMCEQLGVCARQVLAARVIGLRKRFGRTIAWFWRAERRRVPDERSSFSMVGV